MVLVIVIGVIVLRLLLDCSGVWQTTYAHKHKHARPFVMFCSETFTIFSGGLSVERDGKSPCITVLQGRSTTVLEMEHPVVDFVTMCESPWSSGKSRIVIFMLCLCVYSWFAVFRPTTLIHTKPSVLLFSFHTKITLSKINFRLFFILIVCSPLTFTHSVISYFVFCLVLLFSFSINRYARTLCHSRTFTK